MKESHLRTKAVMGHAVRLETFGVIRRATTLAPASDALQKLDGLVPVWMPAPLLFARIDSAIAPLAEAIVLISRIPQALAGVLQKLRCKLLPVREQMEHSFERLP